MNIYEKLQKMRVDLQNMNLKKSGKNTYAGYQYYELGDFLPAINQLMLDEKVASVITYEAEVARLKLINCEKPEECVEFISPMSSVSLKGAHEIQNLGAIETYQRRYLYMTAFEIVESDFFDATQGKDQQVKAQQKKQSQGKGQQQGKKMTTTMSNNLNKAVLDYSRLTGFTNDQIMSEIKKAIGKEPKWMTEEDGKKVLELLFKWQEAYLTENTGA